MSGVRTTLGAGVAVSLAAAGTTWVSILSWRGFTDAPSTFLQPLAVLALVIAGVGALARWSRLGLAATLALQVLVAGMVASYVVTGSPLPVGAAWADLRAAVDAAVDGANTFAPPVPTAEADVDPLLIGGGLGCLLLVDLLAAGLRRASLAGLPLLTVFSVPVSLLGTDLTWWVFAAAALGFVVMLYLQESLQVSRWGRSLSGTAPVDAETTGFGIRTGAVRASAGLVGVSATGLAVVVPLAIPTLDVHLLDIGPGPGGGSDVSIENPMVDLRRDLNRGDDVRLVTLRTDDPDPSYLRISVLNRFTDNEWSSGDRQIPADNRPGSRLPQLVGVDPGVPRQTFDYQVDVAEEFRSTWLPTTSRLEELAAPGDWRYDVSTMDWLATDDDLTTAGLSYTMTGVDLDLSADALVDAPSSVGMVSSDFTELPQGLPPVIRQLASSVTGEAPSRFEKAVALQDFFRRNFEYSLDRAPAGSGTDELVTFLSTGPDGRIGYCEQFAAAMAVMARQLGIPARVAVGFLYPDEVAPGVFEYSAHDLHSWPELFIAGAGWVRFEPTPGQRADQGAPDYTRQQVTPEVEDPQVPGTRGDEPEPSRGAEPGEQPTDDVAPREEDETQAAASEGTDLTWLRPVLGGLVGLAVMVGAALLPRSIRRRRRERALDGGPEEVWLELRDTCTDLGVPWAEDRSPRQTAAALREHLVETNDEVAASLRAGTGPAHVAALDGLVDALERSRYSREHRASSGSLHPWGQTLVAALEHGVTARVRRRATWLPRSLFVRRAAPAPSTGPREDQLVG